jgi:hypothetical protein
MDLEETDHEGVDCVHLTQVTDRSRVVLNVVTKLHRRRGIS